MLLKNRLAKLEAESALATVVEPVRPPTRALEITLEALEKDYLRPLPEHSNMPQVIACELLSCEDASFEARETAQRHLTGAHEH